MQKSIFSERLADIMTRHVVSQDELAKGTHLSQSAVSRLLNSKYEPRVSDLIALASYFKVSVGWFFGEDGPNVSTTTDRHDIGRQATKTGLKRVDVRLVGEAALRALVKKLRKQADDLEHTCDELFRA